MARRREQTSCGHCGRRRGSENTPGIQLVRVEPRRPDVPDVGELALCRPCRNKPERTVHLRYRVPVPA
jgi:hypothetical protein